MYLINKKECPECIGSGEIVEIIRMKKHRSTFIMHKCKLCNGDGSVNEDVTNDYEFKINNEFNEQIASY